MSNVYNINSNSSSTPLGISAQFTGLWHDISRMNSIMVAVATDRDGALTIEQSVNGVDIDSVISYSITGGVSEVHRLVATRSFFRVKYLNGTTAQTYLRLQTSIGEFGLLTNPLNQQVQLDADAVVVRTVESELDIARGKFEGFSIVNKFGKNPDIDDNSTPEDVWGGGGIYTGFPDTALETIEVLSSSESDAAAGTGARTVVITGLDESYNVISEAVTLNGLTPVATTQQFRRAHTMRVASAGSGGVNVGTITARHSTTEANVFLNMLVGLNQTNSSGYTVPAGYTAYIRKLNCFIRSNTTSYVEGSFWIRQFGEVFRQRRPFSVSNTAPHVDEIYGGIEIPEKSDIIVRVTLSTANNIAVASGYDLILVRN